MSQTASRPMSVAAFLSWEWEQEHRYEFDGTAPVAMTRGTILHCRIAHDLARAFNDRLLGGGCEALDGDVKIVVTGRVRYPDVVVTCARLTGGDDVVPEPVFVAEILSPSTARTDRVVKLEEYRLTASIQYYLLLEQETPEGVLYSRDGERWRADVIVAPGDVVLPVLGITVPLVEAYRRVEPPG